MKARHITKTITITSLGTTIFVPICLLTSCASISQWNLPIAIGSKNSPWSEFGDFSNDGKDLYTTGGTDLYKTTTYSDSDPKKDKVTNYFSPSLSYDYLPSSYISFTDPQSGVANYEFAQAYNDVNWNKPDANNTPQLYDYDWLSNSSNKLKYSESLNAKKADGSTPSDKSNEVNVLTSARNLNLSSALNYVPAIGLTINNWSNSLLSFITQDGVLNNKTSQNENDWYSKIFTGETGNNFVPSIEDDQDNRNNFYQFMLDQCNLLSHGKVPAKFATSASDYKFTSNLYGPGPLINDDNAENQFGLKESFVGGDALKGKILTFEGDELSPEFVTSLETPTPIVQPSAAYITYSSLSKDYDAHTDGGTSGSRDLLLPDSSSFILPFLITPTATQYSYFNPLTKHTFQQNDYLIKDKNVVEKAIWKSWQPSWKRHTNNWPLPTDDQLALSWNMNLSVTDPDEFDANPFYEKSSSEDIFEELKNDNKATYIDPSIANVLSKTTTSNSALLPNTYIGFATYQIIPMLKEGQYYNDSTNSWSQYDKSPYHYQYDYMPFCTGLYSPDGSTPAIFPLALLYDKPDSNNPPKLDTSLFNSTLLPEANYLLNGYVDSKGDPLVPEIKANKTAFKDNPANNMYNLDISAIVKKQNNIFKFISKRLWPNSKPSDFDTNNDAQNTFWIWQSLFGQWESNYELNDSLTSNAIFEPIF